VREDLNKHSFPNREAVKNFVNGIHPFRKFIPDELRDEYDEAFLEEMLKRPHFDGYDYLASVTFFQATKLEKDTFCQIPVE